MLETVSFADRPEAIAEQACDCIWIILSARKSPSPLKNPLIEWLDWRLLGKVSRYLAQGGSEKTTFVPGANPHLSARLIAIDCLDRMNWSEVKENLLGMKIRNLFVLFEDWTEAQAQMPQLEKMLAGSVENLRLATERDLIAEGLNS